ncbi:uncharacterized protein LOC135118644 [Helicoverpa armigera]|uniref:uncharacterized protein LOC135118644 n=1 Tax=Helicoverpa armigera TaxID=29058 RepID=UPI000B38097B|nr:uncharacterized protein LOC110379013 [Helicoverpa armigera]PZC86311.1 hypothetical protein B5X24_HaOG211472 [Helicoverpa armigera]
MKLIQIITTICLIFFEESNSVRLHKIFQFIDGFQAEHNLRGYLHVGNDYAIFLRLPKPHDKYLVYELYEARNVPEVDSYKPRMLAITKVPVEYMKAQLQMFRSELFKSKYEDDKIVPGTQVKTLREWQIDRALSFHDNGGQFHDKVPVLRTIL